jgi:hypothetical protein
MVYGFRPYRNRNNPGDGPPKWGLGKTGWIVIALTVVAGILIALMVIGTRSGDASDGVAGPAAPVGIGGYVEVPMHGFAVTLPPGWVWVRESPLDAEPYRETLESVMDPDDAAFYITTAEPPESVGFTALDIAALIARRGDVRGDDVLHQMFMVGIYPQPRPSLDTALAGLEANDNLRLLSTTSVALPIGEVVRVDATGVDADGPQPSSTYFLTDPDETVIHTLVFYSSDPPDDRWLSIAETFEFLPAKG